MLAIGFDLMKDGKITTIIRVIDTTNSIGVAKGFLSAMLFFCFSFSFNNGIGLHRYVSFPFDGRYQFYRLYALSKQIVPPRVWTTLLHPTIIVPSSAKVAKKRT